MFDIKKLFTPNTTLGRLEFLKVYICILILPFLNYILQTLLPEPNYFVYYTSLIIVICYAVLYWVSIYRRLKNIFDSKEVIILLFILYFLIGLILNYLMFYIQSNKLLELNIYPNIEDILIQTITFILLITIPGKKESDKIISNKLFYILCFICIPFLIGYRFYMPFNMSSAWQDRAMEETLKPGDKVFINISEKNYRRGDIISHKYPDRRGTYINRIVGLPGEKIEIKHNENGENLIYINDKLLDEPYVLHRKTLILCATDGPFVVPDDSYFVMGDNRRLAAHGQCNGPISKDSIKGRVTRIFYPFDRAKVFETPNYEE